MAPHARVIGSISIAADADRVPHRIWGVQTPEAATPRAIRPDATHCCYYYSILADTRGSCQSLPLGPKHQHEPNYDIPQWEIVLRSRSGSQLPRIPRRCRGGMPVSKKTGYNDEDCDEMMMRTRTATTTTTTTRTTTTKTATTTNTTTTTTTHRHCKDTTVITGSIVPSLFNC